MRFCDLARKEVINVNDCKCLGNVRDLDFDRPPILSGGVTMGRAWDEFQAYPAIASIPVVNEDGTLYGILSRTDIADYNMSRTNSGVLEEVPLFNAISVLEGKILNDAGESTDTISGEVTIALPQSRENLLFHSRESIVLCGNQPDMIRRALELNVSCLVLCQAEISEELRTMATETCIISTPYDAYRAVHLICHALPIERICKSHDLVSFHLDDYIDDVRNTVLESRFRAYPILDENERVVGTLSRFHLLRPRRKRVILMDHNEKAQSVPGLDQADILEIIDHHRIGSLETTGPVYFRNVPVGCTATILYQMYGEQGLTPSREIAGLLLSAILSDTLVFRSPTSTPQDEAAAKALAALAGEDIQSYAEQMFEAGADLTGRTAEDVFSSDFKAFSRGDVKFGVGQSTYMTDKSRAAAEALVQPFLPEASRREGLPLIFYMFTDMKTQSTDLMFYGHNAEEIIRDAFHVEPEGNIAKLPGVVSRKKQLIPPLLAALQARQ